MADGTQDSMGYGAMINEALRGVVRAALTVASRTGLPGEHHFYITFDTRTEGVVMPPRLLQRYPEEMTIVLQHQFDDLEVSPDRFSVVLSFDHIPDRLVIPYGAVLRFVDPSVSFGLQFQLDAADEAETETAPEPEGSSRPSASVVSLGARREAQEAGATGDLTAPTSLAEKRADSTSHTSGPRPERRNVSDARGRSPSQARTRSVSEAGRRGLTDVDEAAAKLLDGEAAALQKEAEKSEGSARADSKARATPDKAETPEVSPPSAPSEAPTDAARADADTEEDESSDNSKESPAAQVVHIDAFRKR